MPDPITAHEIAAAIVACRDLTDLDDGVIPRPDVHVTVLDVDTGTSTHIPVQVFQWLDTIPQALALRIVESWYAGEN